MNLLNRQILPQIIKQLDNNLALILIGARQTGKTHILKLLEQHIKSRHSSDKLLYLNLEDEGVAGQISDYKNFLNFLRLNGFNPDNEKIFILLDEFQKLARPTKLLKLIYDNHPNIKIIATGSSSLEIHKKMREESMAGRKMIFNIYPLSFSEFLLWQRPDLYPALNRIIKDNLDFSPVENDFLFALEEFIVFGGYPRAVLVKDAESKREHLKEIYNAYIQKDIAGLLRQEDAIKYNKLVALLAAQIGNLLNVNELANTLNCARSTVERFLFVLENTFIIKQLPPYYTNKRKEITKMPKIYFTDTGLRDFSQKNFAELDIRQDAGSLAENAALTEILKHSKVWHDVYFWRTAQGTEVDFIITKDQQLFPVEVKYGRFQKPIVPSGLKAFINIYSPKRAFTLTKNFSAEIKYKDTEVYFIPLFLASKIFRLID